MFGDRCGVWSHVLKQVYIQKIKKKKTRFIDCYA